MPKPRNVMQRFLAVCFGLSIGCLCVGAMWVSYRWLVPPPRKITVAEQSQVQQKLDESPNALYVFDEQTSYRYKPNLRAFRPVVQDGLSPERQKATFPHETNSLGLVGTEEIRRETNVAKILLLGDSVTFGARVNFPDTFAARLQREAGEGHQVVIAACEGWSTKQEVAFYEKFLADVDWRKIYLVVCMNDLVNFEWVFDSSEGFKLAEELQEVGGLSTTNQSAAGLKLALLRSQFAATPATEPLSKQNNTTLWAWDAARWQWYFDTILSPLITRPGCPPLTIVAAPTNDQLQAIALGAEAETVFYPQARLQEFATQHGLTYIDLAEPFAGASQEDVSRLYLDNLHYSEEGHAIVAAYLAPRIRAELEVEPGRIASKPSKPLN